jgi:hypothetical protein
VPDRESILPGYSDPGVNLVGALAQQQEHPANLVVALGLAQDRSLFGDVNDRVRGEYDVVRVSRDGECLAPGVSHDGLFGVFESELGEATLVGLEAVARGVEKFYPAGRFGGEDEAHARGLRRRRRA